MNKNTLNSKIHIVEGNAKLEASDKAIFLTFNLPVKVTCPYATKLCKEICYAQQEERYPSVRKSREENLEESKKDTFVNDMIDHIEWHLNRKKFVGKHIYFRLHSAGDFYNQDYADKYVMIANHFKDNDRITFEAYTKSLPYFMNYNLDEVNITVVYSIMPDTREDHIAIAHKLGLKTFSALPEQQIPQESYKCPGNCGQCHVCYHKDNGLQNIFVAFHGSKGKKAEKSIA